jgi:hypothetical protein
VSDDLKYHGIYRAKVIQDDRLEDDKLGRVKVEVYPMLIGINTAIELGKKGIEVDGILAKDLPWAAPMNGIITGAYGGDIANDEAGSFSIPKPNSFVWVFFEAGDINQPVYMGEAPNKLAGMMSERLEGYPNRRVWKFSSGVVLEVLDSAAPTVKLTHPAGASVEIDASGNIKLESSGDIEISGGTVNINP